MSSALRKLAMLAVVVTLVVSVSGSMIAASPSTNGVTVQQNVWVTMPDGVRLATDIYMPAAQGAYPTILVRTPYGKSGNASEGDFFAQHGYIYVVQDVRGRNNSEGNFDIYVNEGPDGLATAQWIVQQPWFNKELGLALYGGSYLAATALDTAVLHPPYLKAIYAYIASANYHQDGAWRSGAFRLVHNVGFANFLCSNQLDRSLQPGSPAFNLYSLAPVPQWQQMQETPLTIPSITANCPWYNNWANDSEQDWYWNQAGFNHAPSFSQWPHVPTALLGGWYDIFQAGTIQNYLAAVQYSQSPVSLTIGPWTHGGQGSPMAGAGFFGTPAAIDLDTQVQAWFDHWMKGVDNGVDKQPAVKYFLMGGGSGAITTVNGQQQIDIEGSWKSAPSWPLAGVQMTQYYLEGNDTLSTDQQQPRGGPASQDTFTYDPHNPVPTMGGNFIFGGGIAPNGAQNQVCQPSQLDCNGSSAPLDQRPDVLVYQTPALGHDVTVAGPISLTLWASSSAVDTDFDAKLVDVYPNGTKVNIADGVIRARYRNDPSKPQFLQSGAPTKFEIDLWSTATMFKAGHRIELVVSSSNFPLYDRNLNTGNPIGTDVLSDAVVAHQIVYHSERYPSELTLPVVP